MNKKKVADYYDEGFLLVGTKDKYGFHPKKGIQCGFDDLGISRRYLKNSNFAHQKVD